MYKLRYISHTIKRKNIEMLYLFLAIVCTALTNVTTF